MGTVNGKFNVMFARTHRSFMRSWNVSQCSSAVQVYIGILLNTNERRITELCYNTGKSKKTFGIQPCVCPYCKQRALPTNISCSACYLVPIARKFMDKSYKKNFYPHTFVASYIRPLKEIRIQQCFGCKKEKQFKLIWFCLSCSQIFCNS